MSRRIRATGLISSLGTYSRCASRGEAGKKESTGRRLNQLCPPYATPSSNSSLDYPRSDARIVEHGFATSGGLNRSAKVVLGRVDKFDPVTRGCENRQHRGRFASLAMRASVASGLAWSAARARSRGHALNSALAARSWNTTSPTRA